MAKQTLPNSPISVARTVLGQNPRDVATYLKIGSDLFDQLESVFNSIEMLNEKGGSEVHIKNLARLGKFVASDTANLLDCEREKIVASIDAAEAEEVAA